MIQTIIDLTQIGLILVVFVFMFWMTKKLDKIEDDLKQLKGELK